MVSMLPSMFFSDGGKLAIVSVRSLTKKFGSPSGAVLEVRRIVPSPNQAINVGWIYDCVVWEGLSSSTYLGEKSQKSHFIKVWLQVKAFISEFCNFVQLFSISSIKINPLLLPLLLMQYVPASCFAVFSPVKPHGNKLFHPREMPVYFKFESLIKIFRPHNKDPF